MLPLTSFCFHISPSLQLYGILFLAFVLLAIVTSFVVIALTYFQLVVEDYRWWWRSLASGGMVGVFIFMYCFYFYYNHTDMTGFLQTSFYFGCALVLRRHVCCVSRTHALPLSLTHSLTPPLPHRTTPRQT